MIPWSGMTEPTIAEIIQRERALTDRRLLPRPPRDVGMRGSVLLLLQVSGDVLPDED